MKLVNKIVELAEKFNGANIFISTIGSFNFPDASAMYAISSNKGNATKAILFFNNEGKGRLIEVDFKVHLTARFGSYIYGQGDASVIGLPFKSADDFIRTLEKRYQEMISTVAEMTRRRKEDYIKKAGTGSVKEDTGWVSKEQILKILLKNNVSTTLIKRIAELSETEISDVIDVEGFKLIDTLEGDSKVITVIKETAQLLKKHGFGKLNYGKILFSHRAGSGRKIVFADYSVSSDDVRIFTTAFKKGEDNPVLSLTHELGHRYFYKFLNAAQRASVAIKYSQVMKLTKESVADKFDLKAGDIIELKLAKTKVVYKGYTIINPFGGRKMGHVFRVLDANDKETTRYYSFPLRSEVEMIDFIKTQTEGKEQKNFIHKFLPSSYARTNDVEWFAEVFSHGLYNNDKEVIDWLNQLK